MESLLVQPKDKSQLKLLVEMLKMMGMPAKIIDEETKEDIGLGLLMKEADRSQKVTKESIMKKLRS